MYEDQILTLALQGKDLRKLVVRGSDEQADSEDSEDGAGGTRDIYFEP